MDVRRCGREHPHLDRYDASDARRVRVSSISEQWILARGNKSHCDDDFTVASKEAHGAKYGAPWVDGSIELCAAGYEQLSATLLIEITRNWGIAFSLLVVSLVVVSGAPSRSTFVVVSVLL